MSDRNNRGSGELQLKPLVGLAMMVVAVTLVVVASSHLDSEARAVLAGAICALGLIITTGFLIILVRQYHDDF